MPKLGSFDELKMLCSECQSETRSGGEAGGVALAVGMATCGIAAGARDTVGALRDELNKLGVHDAVISSTGCVGLCYAEPIVEVRAPGRETVRYGNVDAQKAREIIRNHAAGGHLTYDGMGDAPDDERQVRIALRNCGVIDPESMREYLARDGYMALGKALFEMSPDDVIATVEKSGLRGRGGAGFPTGRKWRAAKDADGERKYVVCNADEGDPGAFMDRSILEGDPNALLEAMTIAGYAVGADSGVIYIRAEYPLAVERLRKAMRDAEELGLLGGDILGSGFSFSITVSLGAGAFVCGEETALLRSVEGERGEPKTKPPFPAQQGLWDRPTVINNVETYVNVPQILFKGVDWFHSIGTEKSPGTKVFALAGKINNVGLAEVPMGTPLRTIIYDIGGGIQDGKAFKAVQTGGPSGGCIPASMIDLEIDYDNLQAAGSMMGSGGMIVMDEDDCMVNIARFYLEFTVDESCGKCTPCRIGNRRLFEILTKVTSGTGSAEDLAEMESLGEIIRDASLCGLGQSAPNPVLSTLNHFRDEYDAHVLARTCPAKSCRGLIRYSILPEKCIGCTVCARNCPVSCIVGRRKETHVIDAERCIKCGVCAEKCPTSAIIFE